VHACVKRVGLSHLLKRHFRVLPLLVIALAALLSARGAAQVLAISMAPEASELSQASLTLPLPAAPSSAPASADAILCRNAFDSTTGALPPCRGCLGPDDDVAGTRECDGVKVLAIVASSDAEWSFAALEARGDSKSVLRRAGGEVAGKKVDRIGWDRVWLKGESSLCYAKMFAPPPLLHRDDDAGQPPPPGAPLLDPQISTGIRQVRPNQFNVDRNVVDKILENQAELFKHARLSPEQVGGKVIGIRLYGVRPDTLLGVLGMENGDRLRGSTAST
jgi:general secretion pathway protein C